MHTVYGVAERITVLDVQKARLRVLFALRLVSGTTIFKSAGKAAHLRRIMKSVRPCTLFMANFSKAEISLLFKPAASVPLLKILNVLEPPRMAVLLHSSVFAQQTRR